MSPTRLIAQDMSSSPGVPDSRQVAVGVSALREAVAKQAFVYPILCVWWVEGRRCVQRRQGGWLAVRTGDDS